MGSKFLHGRKFVQGMIDAGLLPDGTTDVTITATVNDVVRMEYRTIGEESLTDVIPALVVTEDPAEAVAL